MIVPPSEPTSLIKENIKVVHDQIQPYVTEKKSSKRSTNASKIRFIKL